MKTHVLSNKEIYVRFNNNEYALKGRYCNEPLITNGPYSTKEIDIVEEDYVDEEMNQCFEINRSFKIKVSNDQHIVMYFYVHTTKNAVYKLEIKDGVVYTCDGYITASLDTNLLLKYDDRIVSVIKDGNDMWLRVKKK